MDCAKGNPLCQRLYAALFDVLEEGIHVLDAQGRTLVYNQKMADIESLDRDEVASSTLSELFSFPAREGSTLLHALTTGTALHHVRQTYFNRFGKSITTVNDTLPIVAHGKLLGAIEIARPVASTPDKINEAKLKGAAHYHFDDIVGNSRSITHVVEQAKRACRTRSSVLIVGETGTGKELIAQSLHNASVRSGGPFVSQNCAALPESLMEGMLFGTMRGAFTGALDRPGLLETADGGTFLLDELNSLGVPLQAKLLRFLEDRVVQRIGANKGRVVDVRILATVNEDPEALMASHQLRKDLYFRLGVVILRIPPLRERREDIPLLVPPFIARYNRLYHLRVRSVSAEVMDLFHQHEWPGNVRELEHLIEGAMNLIGDEEIIGVEHLPPHLQSRLPSLPVLQHEESHQTAVHPLPLLNTSTLRDTPFQEQVKNFQRTLIHSALARQKGNVSAAAKDLQLSRQNLQYYLRHL